MAEEVGGFPDTKDGLEGERNADPGRRGGMENGLVVSNVGIMIREPSRRDPEEVASLAKLSGK